MEVTNGTGRGLAKGTVGLSCTHLGIPRSGPPPQVFRLAPGAKVTLVFRWNPPPEDYQGYGVEAWARDAVGHLLDRGSTAVDVSSTWTRFPRYGFLSEYPAQSRATSQNTIRLLNDYHLNGLQFYDWQLKHHRPLAGTAAAPADSWGDIAGRPTSRRTVLDLLAAAHGRGMAAMNYNLLYGAWSGYDRDGVDRRWGLWNKDGTHQDRLPLPGGWATPFLYLFNPADPGWQRYLLIGKKDAAWRDDHADYPIPTLQANVAVRYHADLGTIQEVRWASPDRGNVASSPLPFTRGADRRGSYIRFIVPRLEYWDMVSFRAAAPQKAKD